MFDLVNDFHIAVPTAFYDNEDLNTDATIQHVLNLYSQGVRSVLICGTTGNSTACR
jgi:4-hydroxy-tetrahydrodipicolinate synthase